MRLENWISHKHQSANVGKSKVMRCSKCGNGDRMHVTLEGEPLEAICNKQF